MGVDPMKKILENRNQKERIFCKRMIPHRRVIILLFQLLLALAVGLKWSSSFQLTKHIQRLLTPPRVFISTLIISSSVIVSSSVGYASTLSTVEDQVINLFQEASPSVVYINTYQDLKQQIGGRFSLDVTEVPVGTGSGFVWDKQGHIVTNYHVIRNSASARVTLTDNNGKSSKTFKAKVIGSDPDKDVAVLSLLDNELNLKPIKVGTSRNLRVGQTTLAIGNPFGLDHTLTTGIISGLGREVKSPSDRPISNVIQTDAAINPGNSGGPLLDSNGNLIGMNSAIYSVSGGSAGVGFAIPVDTLIYEVNTLIKDGKISRPIIGINYLESQQSKVIGITKGILVLNCPEGSTAYKAGIRGTSRLPNGSIILGDIITRINDDEIISETDLFKALEKLKVGDIINCQLLRSKKELASLPVDENKLESILIKVQLSERIAYDD